MLAKQSGTRSRMDPCPVMGMSLRITNVRNARCLAKLGARQEEGVVYPEAVEYDMRCRKGYPTWV